MDKSFLIWLPFISAAAAFGSAVGVAQTVNADMALGHVAFGMIIGSMPMIAVKAKDVIRSVFVK